LTLLVNGGPVLQLLDTTYTTFTGIGMYVESGSGLADARFDDLVMSA
jgi:hypothetical protein